MTFQRDLAWQHLELVYKTSVSFQFARYALALNYSMLPKEVVHRAKCCVLDSLGCAIGGYHAPAREICEETVKEIGGPQEATVFGSGLRTSALNASLVNSVMVRLLDYNDLGGGGHNSDALASILAVAEREKKSGMDFITALVISYELGQRFRDSLTGYNLKGTGWTSDVRAGLIQPPALGKLMGLNEEQIAHAIGICMSHALPLEILDAHKEECVMAKNLRFGWAAHDAIVSCMLAKKGFTGPLRIIESEFGIRQVITQGGMDFERLMDFSGWRMLKVLFKGMPANATTHGHVSATLELVKEHDLKPADIVSVRIGASKGETQHTTFSPGKKYPRNAESADHSAFFANAIAIKERAYGPHSFKDKNYTDPIILDLIEKITIEHDPSLNRFGGTSEIVTKDGRRLRKQVDFPKGRAENPFTDKELEEKFTDMAAQYLSKDHIKKIFDACWNLEKLNDVSKLTQLMVFAKANS